jgi:hypothetical protein
MLIHQRLIIQKNFLRKLMGKKNDGNQEKDFSNIGTLIL